MAKQHLGELLVENCFLDEKQLKQVLAIQKKDGHKLGSILIQEKLISEDDLLGFLAQQLDLPVLEPKEENISRKLAHKLPEKLARDHKMVLLSEHQDGYRLLIADPLDHAALEVARAKLEDAELSLVLAKVSIIDAVLERVYK